MVRCCCSTRPEDATVPPAPAPSDGPDPVIMSDNAEAAERLLPTTKIRFAVVGSDDCFMIEHLDQPAMTYHDLHTQIQQATSTYFDTFHMYLAKEWGDTTKAWLLKSDTIVLIDLQRVQVGEEVNLKYLAPSKRIDAKTFDATALDTLGSDANAIHVLVKPTFDAIDEPTGCCHCAPETCRVFLSLLALSFLAMAIVGYIYLSSKNEKGRPDYPWSESLAPIGVVCIGALGFLVTVCCCVNFRA